MHRAKQPVDPANLLREESCQRPGRMEAIPGQRGSVGVRCGAPRWSTGYGTRDSRKRTPVTGDPEGPAGLLKLDRRATVSRGRRLKTASQDAPGSTIGCRYESEVGRFPKDAVVKVVIQSNSGPFALSRRSIAAAASVLPARITRCIVTLLVVAESAGPEAFEYDARRRIAQFCFPGDPRDPQARDRALQELLLGFARLDSDSPFGVRLTDKQRDTFTTFVDEWHPRCQKAIEEAGSRLHPPHTHRLMYIEYKGEGIVGPARIGWVTFSKSGRSLEYRGRRYRSLSGSGFKANYFDEDTGEHYWISGCKRDGTDALYSTTIEIDEDAREAYWTDVRGLPGNKTQSTVRCSGKHAR